MEALKRARGVLERNSIFVRKLVTLSFADNRRRGLLSSARVNNITGWKDCLDRQGWQRNDEMVISSSKYEIINTMMSSFESRMTLTVRRLEKIDLGGYRCVAKNSLGEVDSVIRLYEIPGPGLIKASSTDHNREDYKYSTPLEGPDNQFGSAERSDDEDDKEISTDNLNLILTNSASINMTNKTFHLSRSNAISKLNFNNKVHKIVDKFQIQNENSKASRSYSLLSVMCFKIIIIVFL